MERRRDALSVTASFPLSDAALPMSHGSEKRKRDTHLTIRLTKAERADIKAKADRKGLTEGSYARDVLLDAPAPRQVRRPPIERRELARLLGELGKVGSNINQLAKASNQGVLLYASELAPGVKALEDMRGELLAALGRAP
jgi:hypothetical protein